MKVGTSHGAAFTAVYRGDMWPKLLAMLTLGGQLRQTAVGSRSSCPAAVISVGALSTVKGKGPAKMTQALYSQQHADYLAPARTGAGMKLGGGTRPALTWAIT